MSVVHTSRLRIEKHEGPHRTAHIENFPEPIHFGIHGGIRQFYLAVIVAGLVSVLAAKGKRAGAP